MPELPEVETVRRGLVPVLEHRTIVRAETRRPDLRFPFPDRFVERLSGGRVERLDRRAKFLLLHLSTGDTLIVHLGMSGRITILAPDGAGAAPGAFIHARATNPRHDHVVLHVEGGGSIVYNDPRRFGFMDIVETERLAKARWFVGMGPEPLSEAFNASHLKVALKGRRTPIKAALLDQAVVAGLGNIYVCEALWRAGVSPRRLAASAVQGARAARIVETVKDVIEDALAAGGSSLRDYVGADGSLGYFQNAHAVYGRGGEACPRCSGPVSVMRQSGRSTFFCGTCQR